MAILNFDATEVEPAKGFEPLPTGNYKAVITASEEKKTKAGTGSYLAITFEILEGDCKGRKVWTNLNIDNPNQDAVRIAYEQLSAICHAVGVLKPKDSTQLHDLPLNIYVVSKKKPDDTTETTIKGYKSANSATAPKAAAPAPGTKSPPPWAKKQGIESKV